MAPVFTSPEPRIQQADKLFDNGELEEAWEAYRMADYPEGVLKVAATFAAKELFYQAVQSYLTVLNMPGHHRQAVARANSAILSIVAKLSPP